MTTNTNEIKTQLRPHYTISNRYALSVKLNDHNYITIAEGKKEDLEQIPSNEIEKTITRIWAQREMNDKFMDEIQMKHPKKFIADEYGVVKVYNKNGTLFKEYAIPRV